MLYTDLENILDKVRDSLERDDLNGAVAAIEALRPPDQADLFQELDDQHQTVLLPRLDPATLQEITASFGNIDQSLPLPKQMELHRNSATRCGSCHSQMDPVGLAMENVRLVAALSKALEDAELARDELRHRVKNAFTAAQALATLALPAEHSMALNARIAALARAHDLLDEKLAHQESITLAELIEAELAPYATESPERLRVAGDDVRLRSAQAVALGLAINELATNALKYGALSAAHGRLDVSWRRERDHLVLEWCEADGPQVRAAAIENFGSRLLKRLVEGQLRGSVRRQLAEEGISCILEFPLLRRNLSSRPPLTAEGSH